AELPFVVLSVLRDDGPHPLGLPPREPDPGRRAIVEDIEGEAAQPERFGAALDNSRNVVEGVAELGPFGHVRLAKPRQVGRNDTKSVRELRNEIAEHVPGTRKAVQQQERGCSFRPRLAIEQVETVEIDLVEVHLAHRGSFQAAVTALLLVGSDTLTTSCLSR